MALKRYEPSDDLKVVRELYETGFSQRRLVEELNNRGILTPNGRKWTLDSLQRALKTMGKNTERPAPTFDFPDLGLDKSTSRLVKRHVVRAEKDLFAEANRLQKEVGQTENPYLQAEKLTPEQAVRMAADVVDAPQKTLTPQGRGAQTRKYRELLLEGTGLLVELPEGHPYLPFLDRAEEWMVTQLEIMRRQYDLLGPGPITAVGSAAVCWAQHRFYSNAVATDPMKFVGLAAMSARYAADINVHLKAAHDLAKRENEALKRDQPSNAFDDLLTAAGESAD